MGPEAEFKIYVRNQLPGSQMNPVQIQIRLTLRGVMKLSERPSKERSQSNRRSRTFDFGRGLGIVSCP